MPSMNSPYGQVTHRQSHRHVMLSRDGSERENAVVARHYHNMIEQDM